MNDSETPGRADSAGNGLTSQKAIELLEKYGRNEIKRGQEVSPLLILLEQFNNPMIWLLFAACLIAAFLGELVDAIAIGAIVVVNSVVGFVQEYRAEQALVALRAMTAPKARIFRNGTTEMISAAEVVPGDVLVLESGDVVAADADLIEAHSLYANEATLTGESVPVEKVSEGFSTSLSERKSKVFMGTSVARGTARALVSSTGMKTELGKIAHLLRTTKRQPTPLQKHLTSVSQTLLYLCLIIVAVVGVLGYFKGEGWFEILLSSISLAVAAVPEGLPAIVTVALALGVKRMVSRNVLVRKLPSVETLGSVTVICTDKTGTLTTGVMAVRQVWGEDPKEVLFAASACCEADFSSERRNGAGDPTEVAILVEGARYGVHRAEIEKDFPRLRVYPFDSERKRMSIFRKNGVLYTKGAVESVLPLCKEGSEKAERVNSEMAERGLRVLAVAVGSGEREENLTLLGLVGIADPPRAEAVAAIASARRAGIKTVMITGDHPATARAIAEELGIISEGTGDEVGELVHARATPSEKIEIIRHWKAKGETVAMTGDGVNDAPALKEAHIGIAMGMQGTEVAREASDMVLTDDNFASIIAAVQEGRGIYRNIRKTMVYLLTGNVGEVMVMFAASILGLPLPFLPIHLLWINLVTDGLPALALVMEPVSAGVLRAPPRNPAEPMLVKRHWLRIISVGLLETIVVLYAFITELEQFGLKEARTVAFTTLIFSQMFRSFAARSSTRLFWQVGVFSNLPLLLVVVATLMIQISIHYFGFAQEVFQTVALPTREMIFALFLGLIAVSAIEISKIITRVRSARSIRSLR